MQKTTPKLLKSHFYMAPMQDTQLSVKSVHVVSGNCIPFSNKVVSKN